MKRKYFAVTAALITAIGSPLAMADKAELTQEASAIVKRFADTLKPTLQQALKEDGPSLAVEVCAVKAPAIAQGLSAESGWQVRRVSLKPRNPNAAPDAWEAAALTKLAERQARNDGTDTLVHTEINEHEFRLIKAQPVEQACLTCHGSNIEADLAAALKKFYPEDLATGYSLGEIRGAISLTKSL